ncbi:hypothetical protein ACHAAC_10115 [Aeromicrobium sp. CF4.19]
MLTTLLYAAEGAEAGHSPMPYYVGAIALGSLLLLLFVLLAFGKGREHT